MIDSEFCLEFNKCRVIIIRKKICIYYYYFRIFKEVEEEREEKVMFWNYIIINLMEEEGKEGEEWKEGDGGWRKKEEYVCFRLYFISLNFFIIIVEINFWRFKDYKGYESLYLESYCDCNKVVFEFIILGEY